MTKQEIRDYFIPKHIYYSRSRDKYVICVSDGYSRRGLTFKMDGKEYSYIHVEPCVRVDGLIYGRSCINRLMNFVAECRHVMYLKY